MANEKKKSIFRSSQAKPSMIAGRNIYKDEKGRNILYDKKKKVGYLIAAKDERQFPMYHYRYELAIILVILLVNIKVPPLISVLIGIAVAGILEFRYRTVYIPGMTCITNFQPKKKQTFIQSLVEEDNKPRCILLGCLYLAFGVLLVLNGYQIQSPWYILVLDYVILAGCSYLFVSYMIAVSKIH